MAKLQTQFKRVKDMELELASDLPFFLLNELPTKVNEPHLRETTGFEVPVNRLCPSPVGRNISTGPG